MTSPIQYDLARDYARFGLTRAQADAVLDNRFPSRSYAGVRGRPRAIVLHIQDGSTPGSLSWWTQHDASATVMIQRDGSILRVIPEEHGPWTNGDVQKPTPKGQKLVALGGNPNLWSLTIEAEGNPNTPVPAAQMNSIEWQCREWMRQFPEITVEWVFRHADINTVSRGYCPGPYYEEIIRRLGGTSTGTTTAAPASQYATPDIPVWMTDEELEKGIDRKLGNSMAMACRRTYKAVNPTARRKYADRNAEKVGPDLVPGEEFEAEFVIENAQGWWLLTRWGTRIHNDDCVPPVRIRA